MGYRKQLLKPVRPGSACGQNVDVINALYGAIQKGRDRTQEGLGVPAPGLCMRLAGRGFNLSCVNICSYVKGNDFF